jgi:predicted XRE-type DNA-binding protein
MKPKKTKHETIEVEVGSGNVYADLGLPNPEQLQAKAALMHLINAEIKRRGLTQEQAGEMVDLAQSDISNISRGRGRTYSLEKLLEVLHRLGMDTSILVEGAELQQTIPVYAHA